MNLIRNAATGLALASLGVPQMALAGQCLTRQEASGMIAYALPSVLEGANQTCRPHLAQTSFMVTGASQMIEKYTAISEENWPLAKQAFLKFATDNGKKDAKIMAKLPDEALKPMVSAVISTLVASEIKAETCGDIDQVLAVVSRIAPKDTADLISVIIGIAGRGKDGKPDKIAMCPVQEQP